MGVRWVKKPPSRKLNIGLLNLEPNIVNTAMMQVSKYYKYNHHNVWEYNPLFDYDKVYAFSLFDFTDKSFVPPNAICGGTGFDITSRLPKEIEECDYDWSLYPNCDYSIIWFSRGCIRNCPFCVVRKKEGYIHWVEPKNLNPNGKYIKIMDNNFFANPDWKHSMIFLHEWGQKVDMQGFDVRIFEREHGEALKTLKMHKLFKFAWDNPRENLDDKINLLLDYMKPHKLMCYVLIGFWSSMEEDLYRVEHLIDDFGIQPFVMPFNKSDEYQKLFARWVNNKKIFNQYSWEEFSDGRFVGDKE